MLSLIRKSTILGSILIFLVLNCHSTAVIYKEPVIPVANTEKHSPPEEKLNQGSYVFGIYPSSPAQEISCPGGANYPEVVMTTGVWDSVIHILIGGVYTRKTVEIYCKK
ncbi:hypothetical protein CH373_03080 [Leptospira perolatii]|uniref:Uncharacterized protein n=1 Tax=Leptospira perolatii TaxID=2023191 RepID=A0A2M9ZSH9_9LEPT|nr:hypothetical protein [Leptospira perolatii]PJZ71487.1 hypothetical protein CH360_03075 [Leptospira perolatii]PJZ75022.1 hypothetical protein CH373_03080 [Leptospira perolatii]